MDKQDPEWRIRNLGGIDARPLFGGARTARITKGDDSQEEQRETAHEAADGILVYESSDESENPVENEGTPDVDSDLDNDPDTDTNTEMDLESGEEVKQEDEEKDEGDSSVVNDSDSDSGSDAPQTDIVGSAKIEYTPSAEATAGWTAEDWTKFVEGKERLEMAAELHLANVVDDINREIREARLLRLGYFPSVRPGGPSLKREHSPDHQDERNTRRRE